MSDRCMSAKEVQELKKFMIDMMTEQYKDFPSLSREARMYRSGAFDVLKQIRFKIDEIEAREEEL